MKGLKQLHEEKIIHCNLKPSNIFLTENGVFKLGVVFILNEIIMP
jgi:serine/threonine protein kinase